MPAPVVNPAFISLGAPAFSYVSFAITATNAPTSFAVVNLPPSMSFNTTTGVVSGNTPSLPGIYVAQFTAANASGTSAPQNFTFTIYALALEITTSIATPPPDVCFGTVNDFIALFRTLFDASIRGPLDGVIVSEAQPSVDQHDLIWFSRTSVGQPLNISSYYNGYWRPQWGAVAGDIKFVNLSLPLASSLFDIDGKGLPGTNFDGWQYCNSANGAPDLRQKFILNAGNLGGQIAAGDVGGSQTFTLVTANLPPITFSYDKTHIATPNMWQGGNNVFGPQVPGGNHGYYDSTVVEIGGTSVPVSKMPPFYALVPLIFIGYT